MSGVERAEGFVKEENLWVEDEGSHQRNALALAAAEFGGVAVEGVLRQVDHRRESGDALGKLRSTPARADRGDLDVAPGGHVREEATGLDGVAEAPADADKIRVGQILAVELDSPFVGLDQADHEPEQRGLAAAGRADEGGGRGGADLQRDTAQGGVLAEAFGRFDDRKHEQTVARRRSRIRGLRRFCGETAENSLAKADDFGSIERGGRIEEEPGMNLSARDIADSASSIPEASKREVFVSKACGGDDELIAEVKMMLGDAATVADSTRGLADPDVTVGPDRRGGAVSGAHRSGAAEKTGDVIDHYKLLKPLGEGGFGSVWLAEQSEPVKRRVALKIIKLGMDTKK